MNKGISWLLVFLLVFSAMGVAAENTAEFISPPTMYTLPLLSINMPVLYTSEQFSVAVEDGLLRLATSEGKQTYKKGEIFLVSGEEKIDLKYDKKLKAYTLALAKANINESALKDWRILVETKIKKDKAFPKEVNAITMQHFFGLESGAPNEARYTISTKTKQASHTYMLKHVLGEVAYHEYLIDGVSAALFDRDGVAVKDMSEAAGVKPSDDGVARTLYGIGIDYLKEDVLDIDPAARLIPSFEGNTLIVKTESGKQDYKKDEIFILRQDRKRKEPLKWNAKRKAYVLDFGALDLTEEKIKEDWTLNTYKLQKKGLGPRAWLMRFDMQSGALSEVEYYYSLFQRYIVKHFFGENEFFDVYINGQKSARYNQDGIRVYGEKPVIPETLEDWPDYPKEAMAKEIPIKITFPITETPIRVALDDTFSHVALHYVEGDSWSQLANCSYSEEEKLWQTADLSEKFYESLLMGFELTNGLHLAVYTQQHIDQDTILSHTAEFNQLSRESLEFFNFVMAGYDNEAEFTAEGVLVPSEYVKSKDNNRQYAIEQKGGQIVVKFYDSFGILVEERTY